MSVPLRRCTTETQATAMQRQNITLEKEVQEKGDSDMPDKMIDLGHMEPDYSSDAVVSKEPKKKVKQYPTIWLNDVELPLSPQDVGKTFNITGTIRVTGIEESVHEDKKRRKEYNLELQKIGIQKSARSKLKDALKKNMR